MMDDGTTGTQDYDERTTNEQRTTIYERNIMSEENVREELSQKDHPLEWS